MLLSEYLVLTFPWNILEFDYYLNFLVVFLLCTTCMLARFWPFYPAGINSYTPIGTIYFHIFSLNQYNSQCSPRLNQIQIKDVLECCHICAMERPGSLPLHISGSFFSSPKWCTITRPSSKQILPNRQAGFGHGKTGATSLLQSIYVLAQDHFPIDLVQITISRKIFVLIFSFVWFIPHVRQQGKKLWYTKKKRDAADATSLRFNININISYRRCIWNPSKLFHSGAYSAFVKHSFAARERSNSIVSSSFEAPVWLK